MTELAESSALSELVAALIANKIQAPVPDETVQQLQDQEKEKWKEKWFYQSIQQLLDQKEWIYQSERVEAMLEKLKEEQLLYSVFNSQHHLESSTQLFQFLKRKKKKVSVVYGHKAQGKTQFLFFVFKLLQAIGQKVLFLDHTIMPLEEDGKIETDDDFFCGHRWKDSFQIEGKVKTSLDKFYDDALPESFGIFIKALRQYTRSTGNRIWIVVDEVVLFDAFPISLPKDQYLGPFNWIVTGSAGIGSWVAKKHLENLVFDLPLFTKEECVDFANNLCKSLRINIEDEIDGAVDDWLEERFGGVVGYIAELFLEVSNGKSVSLFMCDLEDRVNKVFSQVAERRRLSEEQLASVWLKDIKSDSNRWNHLRNAGLCGSQSPRGVIFTLILKCLCKYAPEENALSLVSLFRSKFSGDPGLDGCLLELEEILKLRASKSIGASLITYTGQEWSVQKTIDLPRRGTLLNVMGYDERLSRLEKTPTSTNSSWFLIQIPTGFNVIDVVLVHVSKSPAIYGIQITRSAKPFASHRTFDTCLPTSNERLEQLWTVIRQYFQLKNATKAYYVMLAPNCERNMIKPPERHESDYYFSPTRTIPENRVSNPKKRTSDRYPARHPSKKKN